MSRTDGKRTEDASYPRRERGVGVAGSTEPKPQFSFARELPQVLELCGEWGAQVPR
jgi:hypothetical protein